MRLWTIAIFIPAILCVQFLLGQGQPKVAIEIIHKGDDHVGARLVYQVKEAIRKSSSMRLTQENEYRIQLYLVTLNPATAEGYSSVYSTVWTVKIPSQALPILLDSGLGILNTSQIRDVAENIVAKTDKYLAELAEFIKLRPDLLQQR